nr:MAG TPA: hypothetical protein [Caudoviricetes sp.]
MPFLTCFSFKINLFSILHSISFFILFFLSNKKRLQINAIFL